MNALLFPGQGSQSPGMRDEVGRECPKLLRLAIRQVGSDPFLRIDEGTQFAQPAVFCASIAEVTQLSRARIPIECVAGHSLGEFAALVAAGSIGVEEALRLVVLRGRLMAAAADGSAAGGMTALLAASPGLARGLARRHRLAIACDNAPGHVVLAGPIAALVALEGEAACHGARSVRLPIRGAFHSPAVSEIVPAFRAALSRVRFKEPRLPVFSSISAQPSDDTPARLADALTRQVRWQATLRRMSAHGVTRFIDVGPGKLLTGLVHRTLPEADAVTAAELLRSG